MQRYDDSSSAPEDSRHYETVKDLYEKPDEPKSDCIVQNANQNLQNLQNIMQSESNQSARSTGQNYIGDQILGVRNLVNNSTTGNRPQVATSGNQNLVKDQNKINKSKTVASAGTTTVNNVVYAKPSNVDRTKKNDKIADKTMMELNLNCADSNFTKKNIKGVKLIGMEGVTLRRPSLQV